MKQVFAYKTIEVMKRDNGTYFMKQKAIYLCECKGTEDAIHIVDAIRK